MTDNTPEREGTETRADIFNRYGPSVNGLISAIIEERQSHAATKRELESLRTRLAQAEAEYYRMVATNEE